MATPQDYLKMLQGNFGPTPTTPNPFMPQPTQPTQPTAVQQGTPPQQPPGGTPEGFAPSPGSVVATTGGLSTPPGATAVPPIGYGPIPNKGLGPNPQNPSPPSELIGGVTSGTGAGLSNNWADQLYGGPTSFLGTSGTSGTSGSSVGSMVPQADQATGPQAGSSTIPQSNIAGNPGEQLQEGARLADLARQFAPYNQSTANTLFGEFGRNVSDPAGVMSQFAPALQELVRRNILEPAASRGILNSSMTGENMMRLLPELAMRFREQGLSGLQGMYPSTEANVSRLVDPVFQGNLAGELTKKYSVPTPTPTLSTQILGGALGGFGSGLSSLFG